MIQANRMCQRVVKIKRHTFMSFDEKGGGHGKKFPETYFSQKTTFDIKNKIGSIKWFIWLRRKVKKISFKMSTAAKYGI